MQTKIKILITIGGLIGIILYHVTNLIFISDNKDIIALYKIVQIISVIAIIFFTIYNKLLQKIILGKNYIAGGYSGYSQHYISENRTLNKKSKDKSYSKITFEITQTIFEIKISGRSEDDKTGDVRASWYGNSSKQEGDSYLFALQLDSSITEYGILKLSFLDNNKIQGFYYSGDPEEKFTYAINVEKVEK